MDFMMAFDKADTCLEEANSVESSTMDQSYWLPDSQLHGWEPASLYSCADYQQQPCISDSLEVAHLTHDADWWGAQQGLDQTTPLLALDIESPYPAARPIHLDNWISDTPSPYDIVSVPVSPISSPETIPRSTAPKRGAKRKQVMIEEPQTQIARHRRIEKKYRNKIASGLDRLRAKLPCLLDKGAEEPPDGKVLGLATTRKRNKTTIICKAVEYIEHLEQRCEAAQQRAECAEREVDRVRREDELLRLGTFSPVMEGLGVVIASHDDVDELEQDIVQWSGLDSEFQSAKADKV